MDDTIYRQAAIDAVISLCNDCDSGYCGSCRVNYPGEKDARKVLEDLPPAPPKRKKGKWIYGEDGIGIDGYRCDKCGFFVPWNYIHKLINPNYIEDYSFCPHCGADMKEEKE